jgi:flagellar hook-basal body complex protein FliE
MIRTICTIALSAFMLIGCQSPKTVDMTVAAKSAYTAKATYAAALTLAVAYNARPRCTEPKTVQLCSDQNIVDQLRKASAAADNATQAAENAVRSLGAQPTVVQTAVTASETAVAAFQTIVTIYNPQK